MQRVLITAFLGLLRAAIVRADLNKQLSSHVTGAVRIKRSSISDPVIQCISQSGTNNEEYCPQRVGNWSDVHCFNNSFGLYTPKSQFMNLGSGPLGINLKDGLLQYVAYLPVRNSRDDQEDEAIRKKIEKLIEERAKMETRARFFEKRSITLEVKMEELKQQLEKAEEQKYADSARIDSLSTRLSRWEEGTAECKNSIASEQNKLSAALEISSSHIEQLEKENAAYIDTNKQLANTVASLRASCNIIKASGEECNSQLTECKTALGICEYSERECDLSLGKQTKLHEEHVVRTESEYNSIHNSLGQVREELAECTASLDEARHRNGDLQKSRDSYISRLSKEMTLLKQCNDNLQNCKANHSVSLDLHGECRDEVDKFSSRFSHIQDQYMKCASNLADIKIELGRLREQNTNLSVSLSNKDSQLEKVTHQIAKLEKRIPELMKEFDNERAVHKEVKSQLLLCQKELRNITEINKSQENVISKANDNVEELNKFKDDCVKKNAVLMKDAAIIRSKLIDMEVKFNTCQKQLNKYSFDNDKLLSMTSISQGELASLKKMYDIVVKKNFDCMTKHNVSAQKLDDWKDQYLKCSNETKNLTASLLKCKAKNEFLNDMIKSLEQEAEVSLQTNKNLAFRVSKQTTIISELTRTVAEADIKANDLQNENAALIERLESKQALYLLKIQQYANCSNNYSQSLERITNLEQSELFNSELMDSVRKQAKESSDQLMEAEKSLAYNKALLQQSLNDILGLEAKIKTVQELYDNERERRLAVDKELQRCRGNRTGTMEESHAWQLKLEACMERIGQVIGTQEKDFQEVEKRLSDLTTAYENAIEAHRQMNATYHFCKKEKAALEGEREVLQHKAAECSQKLHITIQRTQHIIHLRMLLQQRLDTCSSDLRQCQQLLKVQKEKFYRCDEQVQGLKLELEFTRTQLEQCQAECKGSALACPEGPAGETYVITSSGCLMQTSVLGSEKEMETYCHDVSGQLLTLETADTHFNKDIMQMLEYSGERATLVWVLNPNQPEEDCYSADMSRLISNVTRPVEYSKTSCDKKLPGICFSPLPIAGSSHGGMGGLLSDFVIMDDVSVVNMTSLSSIESEIIQHK